MNPFETHEKKLKYSVSTYPRTDNLAGCLVSTRVLSRKEKDTVPVRKPCSFRKAGRTQSLQPQPTVRLRHMAERQTERSPPDTNAFDTYEKKLKRSVSTWAPTDILAECPIRTRVLPRTEEDTVPAHKTLRFQRRKTNAKVVTEVYCTFLLMWRSARRIDVLLHRDCRAGQQDKTEKTRVWGCTCPPRDI